MMPMPLPAAGKTTCNAGCRPAPPHPILQACTLTTKGYLVGLCILHTPFGISAAGPRAALVSASNLSNHEVTLARKITHVRLDIYSYFIIAGVGHRWSAIPHRPAIGY